MSESGEDINDQSVQSIQTTCDDDNHNNDVAEVTATESRSDNTGSQISDSIIQTPSSSSSCNTSSSIHQVTQDVQPETRRQPGETERSNKSTKDTVGGNGIRSSTSSMDKSRKKKQQPSRLEMPRLQWTPPSSQCSSEMSLNANTSDDSSGVSSATSISAINSNERVIGNQSPSPRAHDTSEDSRRVTDDGAISNEISSNTDTGSDTNEITTDTTHITHTTHTTYDHNMQNQNHDSSMTMMPIAIQAHAVLANDDPEAAVIAIPVITETVEHDDDDNNNNNSPPSPSSSFLYTCFGKTKRRRQFSICITAILLIGGFTAGITSLFILNRNLKQTNSNVEENNNNNNNHQYDEKEEEKYPCSKTICYPNLDSPQFTIHDLCNCNCYKNNDQYTQHYHLCVNAQDTTSSITTIPTSSPAPTTISTTVFYPSKMLFDYMTNIETTVKDGKQDQSLSSSPSTLFQYGVLRFDIYDIQMIGTKASLFLYIPSISTNTTITTITSATITSITITANRVNLPNNNWLESSTHWDNILSHPIDQVGPSIHLTPDTMGEYVELDITDLFVKGKFILLLHVTPSSSSSSSSSDDTIIDTIETSSLVSRSSSAVNLPYIIATPQQQSNDNNNKEEDSYTTTTTPTTISIHCPQRYTGLIGTNQCQQYYTCVKGNIIGKLKSCQDDKLFRQEIQQCDVSSHVHDDCSNTSTITAQPTPSPTEYDPTEGPDSAHYSLVYKLYIPEYGNFKLNDVPYTIDNTFQIMNSTNLQFDRVAYHLQLDSTRYGPQHVWVSFDAHTQDIHQLGVPTHDSGIVFQQRLYNMTIQSNLQHLNGKELTGNIEFWPFLYGTSNTDGINIPYANNDVYDWGDTHLGFGDFGSMQIHSYELQSTIFGCNRWAQDVRPLDLGIGNSPESSNTDWTFHANAGIYSRRELSVYIRSCVSC